MSIKSAIAGIGAVAVAAGGMLFGALHQASADSTPSPGPYPHTFTAPTPYEAAVEPVCEEHTYGGSEVEAIAWDEIARIDTLGIPVCHVQWEFSDHLEGSEGGLGSALYREGTIWINTDYAMYGAEGRDEAELRSVVRHEIGHFLIRWSTISDREADLRQQFADPVTVDGLSRPGSEVAAEAVGAVLSDLVGDDFQLYYVETVSPASLDAAAAVVEEFTW